VTPVPAWTGVAPLLTPGRDPCHTGAVSDQSPVNGQGRAAGFCPCFPVTDIRAALAHYEQLGFEVMRCQDGAQWGWARFGTAELHLYLKSDHDPARTAAAADLSVEDCDALERQWSATGVPGTSDPYDTAYGTREAVHVDPDNNLIRFGSSLKRP
jgi:Glyoxalase/Bleomycin resistance protein/Dioxygenase superfamily